MARFVAWCTQRGLSALPADPATVCVWLADQAPVWRAATPADPLEVVVEGQVCEQDGLRPATIARRLASISVVHRAAGVANPAGHEQVRATMAGIRRHPGVAPARRRTAARTEQVLAMTHGLDPETDAVDARDLALILIGYAAALRRSDLARLDLADLTVDEHGLSVRIRRSKTDQEADGAVVGIAADDDGACPAAEAWALWRTHLTRSGVTRGAAWRPIHRSRQDTLTVRPTRLSGRSISDVITRRAAQVGLDGRLRVALIAPWVGHRSHRQRRPRTRSHAPRPVALEHDHARLRRRRRTLRRHQPHPPSRAAAGLQGAHCSTGRLITFPHTGEPLVTLGRLPRSRLRKRSGGVGHVGQRRDVGGSVSARGADRSGRYGRGVPGVRYPAAAHGRAQAVAPGRCAGSRLPGAVPAGVSDRRGTVEPTRGAYP